MRLRLAWVVIQELLFLLDAGCLLPAQALGKGYEYSYV